MSNQHPTYAQKIGQAAHEAKTACVGLIATIAVWCVLGFGLSGVDVTFFGIPLWVWTGCLGTWAFAICFALYMARHVIVDVPLDDASESERGDGGIEPGKTEGGRR